MFVQLKNYTNYAVDENGNVKNLITKKILAGSIGENGYKYYRLRDNNQPVLVYAHRLVAETFLDNINNLPVVNHKDGNKLNNNINNLEWTNYAENAQHAYNNNLIAGRRETEKYEADLENEYWLPVPNTHYSVSNMGRTRNDKTLVILKPSLTSGYYKVRLSNNGVVTDISVHNLVYTVFNNLLTIPKGYVVNHKDANKLNNCLTNLELITLSENVNKAYYETKTNSSCKAVNQYNLNGEYIATYPSTKEAARQLNLDSSTISKVCRGINKTHGGFIFKYVD